jgi:hypothetical protein
MAICGGSLGGNMLKPRVEGVSDGTERVSGSGCGVLARCKVAGKQLEAQSIGAQNQLAGYSNVDELLSGIYGEDIVLAGDTGRN